MAGLFATSAIAANDILVNEFVKAGVNESKGTFGSGGNTPPGLQYDSTGAGSFNAAYDYLTPGSPFDGFSIKVNGTNYTNNNSGTLQITGGWTSGTTPNATGADWTGTFTVGGNTWTVRNLYSLTAGTPYVNITTTITAGGSGTGLWLGRFIDPDARAASGDSSVTDNVLGYGIIPSRNVAFSEALASRYALGLYSTDSNVYAGTSGWSTQADAYQTSKYGSLTYGRGDDTIGLSWDFGSANAGDIFTANYAYIFGPSAFGAASSAIAGGAGGGTAGVTPFSGTLTDVGSATSAATSGATGGTPAPTTYNTVTGSTPVTTDTLATGSISANGGTLKFVTGATTVSNPFALSAGGMTVDANSKAGTLSGVISGVGGLTFTGAGSTTLTAVNTYTGATAVNSGATLINNGSIASSSGVANSGTFTNNGAAPGITNNSGATFTNSTTGTTASLINSGTATNSGTITGGVANNVSSTFTNSGTTGDVTNYGTVTNSGTVANVATDGTFTNSSTGTVTGNVLTANTFTNNGTIVGTVNNQTTGVFDNAGSTGAVTNGGLMTNSGSTGTVTNTGTFTTTGTTGDVTNSGTFTVSNGVTGNINNTGTLIVAAGTTGDVVNSSNVTISGGSTGTVTNTGTFNYTGGTVGGVNNSGAYNITGAGSTVTVGNYTQTPTGITFMNMGQQLNVSGTANLDGAVVFSTAPGVYGYGKYPFLTAGTLNGNYTTLGLAPDYISPLGFGLVRDNNTVSLEITPSSAHTMNSINQTAANLSNMNTLKMSNLGGGLNYDCSMFGENGLCVSAGSRFTTDGAGKIQSGSLTVGKKIDKHWRVGAFADKSFGDLVVGNIKDSANPLVGAFANWNQDGDGEGLTISVAAATASSNLSVNREGSLYSESAQGKTSTNGNAYQVKASYTTPLNNRTNISPYIGVRQTNFTTNGYTETGAVYPVTYNSVNQAKTDLLAGVNVSHDFDDKWSGFITGGVITNLVNKQGTLSGSSNIIGLKNFSTNLTNPGGTTPVVGAGISYDVTPTQVIGLSVGWQQQSGIKSGALTYTVGF